MRLYLARHGQSAWQTGASADADSPLTDLGREQSRRLADWLCHAPTIDDTRRVEITSLCVSPSRRARETASYASESLHLRGVSVPELLEATFRVEDQLPAADDPLGDVLPRSASASYAAFAAQTRDALRTLIDHVPAGPEALLAITHAGVIRTILMQIAGSDRLCCRVYNTGLSLIEWRAGRWHLEFLNLADHLPPAVRTY